MARKWISILAIVLFSSVAYWSISELRQGRHIVPDEASTLIQSNESNKGKDIRGSLLFPETPINRNRQRVSEVAIIKKPLLIEEDMLPENNKTDAMENLTVYSVFGDNPQNIGPVLDADAHEPEYTMDVAQDTGPILDADVYAPEYTTDIAEQDTGPIVDAEMY